MVVVAMLGKIGYADVLEAGDGREALEILRLRQVDLVLTDWLMPEVGGAELVRQIRGTPSYADLPVIVFSSSSDQETVSASQAVGADTFLAKPFSPRQLKGALVRAIGQRTRQQVERVILSADPVGSGENHTLVIVGARVVTAERLAMVREREMLHFLSAMAAAVDSLNDGVESKLAGYTLETDGAQIARRVRGLPQRARILMLSSTLPSSVTTARLLSINRPSGLKIFYVTGDDVGLTSSDRHSLLTMGVEILERRQLDAESIEKLLREQEAFAAAIAESELPSPEAVKERLQTDIRATAELPVLAQVFQKITLLDHDPDSALQDWVDVIETDPLSSAQVIRRARSAAYGFQGDVSDTDRAVVVLGKDEVKEIVVSGAVKRSLDKVTEKGFSVDDYWLHSVAVAVTSRVLSFPLDQTKWGADQKKEFERLGLSEVELALLKDRSLWSRFELRDVEDPFVGGIMHDIGKVVLAHAYPGLFPAVLEELKSSDWSRPMSALEAELTGGSDHGVVGGVLASDWDLGEPITSAVLQHHSPTATSSLARLVAISDFVASALYPFPAEAKYPHVKILADMTAAGDAGGADARATMPEGLATFLPDTVTDAVKTSRGELLEIGCALAPSIRRLVQGIQNSV